MRSSGIRRFAALTAALSLIFSGTSVAFSADESELTVYIDTEKEQKLISPYIYGISSETELSDVRITAVKQGDVGFSSYNWENNASNSGPAFYHENNFRLLEDYPESRWGQPGLIPEKLVEAGALYNVPMTVTTLPLSRYVAADGNGIVLSSQIAPSERFKALYFKKGSPFADTPDLNDEAVYIDEYINYLIQKFGKADTATGIKGYALDYEPELWSVNQPVLNIEPISMDELISRSEELANVIKNLDSSALVYGGEFSGIRTLADFGGSEEWSGYSDKYKWFLDYYLTRMREAGASAGKRIFDVLDIHYFSEDHADDCSSVAECTKEWHEKCRQVRVQSTRTLWDGSYTENSEIAEKYQQYLPLLPMVRASVNQHYPGTKIALSAYNFGGGNDISGGIAEADALGIFASQDIYMACLSPKEEKIPYQKAAINLYTNYDGNGAGFGNTLVKASVDKKDEGSVYASIDDGNPEVLKIILLNKNTDKEQKVSLYINSPENYRMGLAYGFDESSPDIRLFHSLKNISNNAFSYTVKPMTAVELVLYSENYGSGSVTETESSGDISEITVESLETTPSPVTEAPATKPSVTTPVTVASAPKEEEKEAPKFIKTAAIVVACLTAAGAVIVIIDIPKKRRKF